MKPRLNCAEAMRWWRRAAEQGLAEAQTNLGNMYNNGEGVPQDSVLAHMWLNLAAAQGQEEAKTNRDIVAKRMTPAQLAEAQRLAREWKPK
jgi:TPR repeat protein